MSRRWAAAPYDRRQQSLMAPTMDDMIPADHEIRVFDGVFQSLDWSSWEREYEGARERLPVHPRLLSGCILYGLQCGVRYLRELEDACRHRIDFIWFLEGQRPDHSTFDKFQDRFGGAD